MALSGRSGRHRATGGRWIGIGVLLTLVVLLIDASVHSRSTSPEEELAVGAWIDRVLPLIQASNSSGDELAAFWHSGLDLGATQIHTELAQIASESSAAYAKVVSLRPPASMAGPAGLLAASFYSRSEAASALDEGFNQYLGSAGDAAGTSSSTVPAAAGGSGANGGDAPAPAGSAATAATALGDGGGPVAEITRAGHDLLVGDQAYALFAESVPASAGIRMPPSTWLADPAPYGSQAAEIFLATLASAAISAPVYDVKVYSLQTDPPGETSRGGVEVLPDAEFLTLTMVLADVGNQPENDLTLTASLSPAGRGTSSVRDFVSLVPGEAHTVVGLGPLTPPEGVPVTLSVKLAPPAGAAAPVVTSTVVFTMPAPPSPSTTSTTVGRAPAGPVTTSAPASGG